eukprot:g1764.t1
MTPGLIALGTKLINCLFRAGRLGGGAVDFRRVFAKMDRKKMGSVTRAEFKTFVMEQGVAFSAQDLEALTNQIDSTASGTISYTEFADFIDALHGHIAKNPNPAVTL